MQQGEARQRASRAWVGKRRSGAHITARPPFVAFVARTCLMLSMKLFPKRLTKRPMKKEEKIEVRMAALLRDHLPQ